MDTDEPAAGAIEPAPAMAPLTRLVAVCALSDPTVDDLGPRIEARAARHRELGITGVLAFCAGRCVQVLEGAAPAVEDCRRELQDDPRCLGLQELLRTEGSQRVFPGWPLRLVFLPSAAARRTAEILEGAAGGDRQAAGRLLFELMVAAAYT